MSEEVTTTDAPNTPKSIDDLSTAMQVTGTVKRIELYGAFVDIGVGQDALLHISQLGKQNVRNVEDVVKVGEEVTVYVLKVDKAAGRIAVSIERPPERSWNDLNIGDQLTGKVVRIENFGAFIDIGAERPGMVHVSEMAEGFVKSPADVVSIGQEVSVRVLKINKRNRQIDLSMKEAPQESFNYQEEEEEDAPTAMALAFRRAMNNEDGESEADRQARKSERARRQQDDIIARTLKNHSATN